MSDGLQKRLDTLQVGAFHRGSQFVVVIHSPEISMTLARNGQGTYEVMQWTDQSMKFNESTQSWYDLDLSTGLMRLGERVAFRSPNTWTWPSSE